jgi:N-acetylneuraminic acid mutarotase
MQQRQTGKWIGLAVTLSLLAFVPSATAASSWSVTGSMAIGRQIFPTTRLPDGRVLVTGGLVSGSSTATAAAEVYDPVAGTWGPTGSLSTARSRHIATLLADGRVLVAGGRGSDDASLATAELYDPSAGTWSSTGSMLSARDNFSATRLRDGRVLVAGGVDTSPPGPFVLKTAEIYDPQTGSWSITGSMSITRFNHQATLLADGRVLVSGGFINGANYVPTRSAEVYDPTTGDWKLTGTMTMPRAVHTAVGLANGEVLVAGGLTLPAIGPQTATPTAELFDPQSGTWQPTASMTTPRRGHGAVALGNDVLVVGGLDATSTLASAEIYHPQSESWSSAGSMSFARAAFGIAVLVDGRVLVCGGFNPTGPPLRSAELYTASP